MSVPAKSKLVIMESSPTSNQSINDKPDELVSSRADVHSNDEPQASSVYGSQQILQAQQQQQSEQPAQHSTAQLSQLQKKCSHHRMFDTVMVNERIAAFTNAVLQRVGQQAQAQAQSLSQMLQVRALNSENAWFILKGDYFWLFFIFFSSFWRFLAISATLDLFGLFWHLMISRRFSHFLRFLYFFRPIWRFSPYFLSISHWNHFCQTT